MTAELRALNARFINNFITNDVAGHDAILHEGFICIAPTGVRVSRAERVGLKDGVETVSMTMYTDIYVRDGGAWKCVQAQITPIQPANYPPDETIVAKYVKGKAQP